MVLYVRDTKLREYILILISMRALFFPYYRFLSSILHANETLS